MNERMIDTTEPEPEKQPTIRQDYSSPILEEYGNLHELTHGFLGDSLDSRGAYRITGMPEP